MVRNSPPSTGTLIAIGIGNTRTRWAVFAGRELTPGGTEPNASAVGALREAVERADPEIIAIASVDEAVAAEIEAGLAALGVPIALVGRDVAPPLKHTLDDASTLGIDRALCAVAAFSLVESAVAIVDAGTAITVDFVDGEGTFHGGAIAPGCGMMLRALHEQTAALPQVKFDPLATGPFGKDTPHAMQLGVAASARGLVRGIVEGFAEHYEAYPRVLGTGGDMTALFEGDEFVERIIPDLQLIGIQRTVEHANGDGD
jgi:type III pantothenate kinase